MRAPSALANVAETKNFHLHYRLRGSQGSGSGRSEGAKAERANAVPPLCQGPRFTVSPQAAVVFTPLACVAKALGAPSHPAGRLCLQGEEFGVA